MKLKRIDSRHVDDCIRIQNILLRYGLEATLSQAEEIWGDYSEGMAASWLFLPDNDKELLGILLSYIEE